MTVHNTTVHDTNVHLMIVVGGNCWCTKGTTSELGSHFWNRTYLTLLVLDHTRQKFFSLFLKIIGKLYPKKFSFKLLKLQTFKFLDKILGTLLIDVLRGMNQPRKNRGRLENTIFSSIFKFFFSILKIIFFNFRYFCVYQCEMRPK